MVNRLRFLPLPPVPFRPSSIVRAKGVVHRFLKGGMAGNFFKPSILIRFCKADLAPGMDHTLAMGGGEASGRV